MTSIFILQKYGGTGIGIEVCSEDWKCKKEVKRNETRKDKREFSGKIKSKEEACSGDSKEEVPMFRRQEM